MYHHDQRYIDALRYNNQPLLEELYKNFSGKIKWMILHNHGTEADAADVFQEALLSINRKAATGDFILTCPFEAFLYTVCKRRWLKELKKRKLQGVTFHDNREYMISDDNFKLVAEMERTEARRLLFRQKLQELNENCRQLLRLKWSGRSLKEIAESMNISYTYARKKKSQCMARLVMLVKRSPDFDNLK
ncbi:MAG TPA: sigma-70 family RNA polymerase sigma factor [Parafilimonas sp.]|nr:sigma-70 family RNA polymerase sigma factor [Parafilimonas sp.]